VAEPLNIADLQGTVAVVTGAGRGIGHAIAVALAQAGADVVATDLDEATAKKTAAEVAKLGRKSLVLKTDVGSLADIERMMTETVARFGKIDVLVNNAGFSRYAHFLDVSEQDWDALHRVNAKGTYFAMQRAAKEMVKQGRGGRIINIASIAGKGSSSTSNSAYAAAKGAVITMTAIAAQQLGRYDINVNAICPGVTETPLAEQLVAQASDNLKVPPDEFIRRRTQTIPLGRTNGPEDIAAMAVFLAGPGGRNITGQAINVDGGLVMH